MERKNERILFSDAEQLKFGVSSEVGVESALETADRFILTTYKMQDHAAMLDDSTSAEQQARRRRINYRAVELRLFANEIISLCVSELADEIIKQARPSD